jgi:pyruvate kinase
LLQTDQVVISTGSTPVKEHLPTNVIKITKIN